MKSTRESRFRLVAETATPAVAAYLQRRIYPLRPADVDDLVEEVLIVAWRRLDDIPAGAEIPWLIGVARNVRRNAVRKQQHADAYTASLRPSSVSPSAEDEFIADQGVREALAAMNEDDRETLLLHVWDGRSADEIAAIFNVTPNAAAVRLSRAQERFRRHFAATSVN